MNLRIFSSLHSRKYRIYFIGQSVSLIGTWMYNIALGWLVYRLTDSVFLLGLVGFTSQIPNLVLTPFTGVITDRHNRLRLMTVTQVMFLLQASAMALLVLTNLVQVWHVVALSLVAGTIGAFDAPVRHSLVIDLIDNPNDLGNAIALNSAVFNSARLIGPAVAGFVISFAGEGFCFLLNALSYVAVVYALTCIKIDKPRAIDRTSNYKKGFSNGVKYTFSQPKISTLIITLACFSVCGLSYVNLLPAYAKTLLGGGPKTLGFLMSALGAGALLGALYMASRRDTKAMPRLISFGIPILGLSLMLASKCNIPVLSALFFFACGLTMILSSSSINILLQSLSDDNMRGRVMSFYTMAMMGMTPVGNLLVGSVASKIGLNNALLFCGIITIVIGALYTWRRKVIEQMAN
ncbi:MAG: MFS transporter [Salinivirgaceae bacterium]|nr:MFS transporter [Salinivirgaceae bacterium]